MIADATKSTKVEVWNARTYDHFSNSWCDLDIYREIDGFLFFLYYISISSRICFIFVCLFCLGYLGRLDAIEDCYPPTTGTFHKKLRIYEFDNFLETGTNYVTAIDINDMLIKNIEGENREILQIRLFIRNQN